MKQFFKRLILGSPLDGLARLLLNKPHFKFSDSGSYWEDRYKRNGNSGAGSYGRLARFKADVLNELVQREDIKTVIEFGCGDGNQLRFANYPKYVGYDVSQKSIRMCKALYADDKTKKVSACFRVQFRKS